MCSLLTETDFTVLLRFRNSSVRLAESHDELKLNMSTILAFSRQSVLSRFEIIQINLTDSDFHQHYRALIDEPRIFGAIGTLPNEHKGFRRDIAQHHPPVLNSHFGSLAVSHPSAKHALVDSTFFNHFTQRLFATFYRPPYSEDSPAEAISKCSEAATCVSQSLSLWVGVNVSLEAQFLSGSDANNFLESVGVVAVGDNSYAAGRGGLQQFSARSFVLESFLKSGQPIIPAKQREFRVWELPYGDNYKDIEKWSSESDLEVSEEKCLSQIKIKIETAQEFGCPISVFLLELVTSDTMLCLRGQFLNKLSVLLNEHGIYLAVDDVMAGLRCGYPLSIQMYGKPDNWPITPQLVTIGKAFGTSALLSLNVPRELKDKIKTLRGCVTNQFCELQLCRLQEHLRVTAQHEIMNHIRSMPNIINRHFQDFLRQHEQSFVSGIGAMHFTNMKFDSRYIDGGLIQFHRLLPPLNASDKDFKDLVPNGIHRCVLKGVSPDLKDKIKLISLLDHKSKLPVSAKQKRNEGISQSRSIRTCIPKPLTTLQEQP